MLENSLAKKTQALQRRLLIVCLFSVSAAVICSLYSWLPLVLASEPLIDPNNLSMAGFANVAGFFISMQLLYGAVRQGYRALHIQVQGLTTTPNPLLGYLAGVVFFLLGAHPDVVFQSASTGVLATVLQVIWLLSAVMASMLGSRQS